MDFQLEDSYGGNNLSSKTEYNAQYIRIGKMKNKRYRYVKTEYFLCF